MRVLKVHSGCGGGQKWKQEEQQKAIIAAQVQYDIIWLKTCYKEAGEKQVYLRDILEIENIYVYMNI